MPARARSPVLHWGLILALGAAGTVIYHGSLFASAFGIFSGGRGDPRAFTYHCEH